MFKKRRKKWNSILTFLVFKPEENLSTKVALVTNGPVSNLRLDTGWTQRNPQKNLVNLPL